MYRESVLEVLTQTVYGELISGVWMRNSGVRMRNAHRRCIQGMRTENAGPS